MRSAQDGQRRPSGPILTGQLLDGETGEVLLNLREVPLEAAIEKASARAEEAYQIKVERRRAVASIYFASAAALGVWEAFIVARVALGA